MSFQNCMELCLPPANAGGQKPHISGSVFTSYRNRPKTGNKHAAVDFNYMGGQSFNRKKPYPIYSPVNGVIDGTYGYAGRYGVVTIKDDEGNYHGILHMLNIVPKLGQRVSVGQKLGIMGGKGPSGPNQYDIHVHYQLRNKNGVLIDPVAFWDGVEQVYTAPMNPEDADPHDSDPNFNASEPVPPTGSIEDYMPRQAGISEKSAIGYALWTNRVPMHEPWPRTMMVDTPNLNAPSDEIEHNINHTPQYTDDSVEGSKGIGRVEGEDVIKRGPFWRR